jgi:hypothetical protein
MKYKLSIVEDHLFVSIIDTTFAINIYYNWNIHPEELFDERLTKFININLRDYLHLTVSDLLYDQFGHIEFSRM